MLELINQERAEAGLSPVRLGDNPAAQLHADASLDACVASHWGTDGLKPYMRYSLAGGYQSNGENIVGLDYCIKASDGYRAIGSIQWQVVETMGGLMDSPGHRANILDPWHKAVNIGLTWDRYNFVAVQHFEGDYVDYRQLPSIDANGRLTLDGVVKNGVALRNDRDLGVQIFYDPPPRPLTRGQLSRTYCYDSGLMIAALREPLEGGRFYREDNFTAERGSCSDPYSIPADAPGPRSYLEAHRFWQVAFNESEWLSGQRIKVPWITAGTWRVSGANFSVTADLGSLLSSNGPGVYTVNVWGRIATVSVSGRIASEDVVISDYAIFHDVPSPRGQTTSED